MGGWACVNQCSGGQNEGAKFPRAGVIGGRHWGPDLKGSTTAQPALWPLGLEIFEANSLESLTFHPRKPCFVFSVL